MSKHKRIDDNLHYTKPGLFTHPSERSTSQNLGALAVVLALALVVGIMLASVIANHLQASS